MHLLSTGGRTYREAKDTRRRVKEKPLALLRVKWETWRTQPREQQALSDSPCLVALPTEEDRACDLCGKNKEIKDTIINQWIEIKQGSQKD